MAPHLGAVASKKIGSPCMARGLQASQAQLVVAGAQPVPGMSRDSLDSTTSLKGLTPIEAFADCLHRRWMSVEQVMREADADGSGEIEWEEFHGLCAGTLRLGLGEGEIRGVFHQVDTDGSGSVSAGEMSRAVGEARKRLEKKMLASIASQEEEAGRVGEVPDTKLVALVAHNNMKASMMSFVGKHYAFFRRVRIVTTGSTGSALEKNLHLSIATKVASGPLGGDQEIGSMITQNEVGAAFFFIDPLTAHPHEADIRALTRICEVHNCACATNPVTGEALVYAFSNSPPHVHMLHKHHTRRDSDAVKQYKEGQQRVISTVAGGV